MKNILKWKWLDKVVLSCNLFYQILNSLTKSILVQSVQYQKISRLWDMGGSYYF